VSPLIPHQLTGAVITAAIEVHRGLGPGLLESAYDQCLAHELRLRRIRFDRQVAVPLTYKGAEIPCGYRVDFVVNGELMIELKAVEHLLPIHQAQAITYLRLLRLHRGLLINFNAPRLVDGLKSFLNGPPPKATEPCSHGGHEGRAESLSDERAGGGIRAEG
jgi:GxxExxY protein